MSGFEPLVGFKNNFDDNDLYYFDFSSDKWVKCKPIGRLPYNLCKYQIENSEQTFVTCTDSYRLIDNLDNALSNDEMYKEKEWRDNVVKKNEELDLYSGGKWHKMVVAWIKADIIPDVLHLKSRRNESNLCGYFYKESQSLAKSCSKTPVITQEQLQKEKEQDEQSMKYHQEKRDKIIKIEKTLKLFKIKDECHKFYADSIKKVFFYDTLPYYQSLRLDKEQKVISKEDWSPEAKITYEQYLAYSNREKGFINLVRQTNRICEEENTTDMVSVEDEYTDLKKSQIENCNYQYLKCDYDAFYNIKIYNATYATLCCDPRKIDCDIIDTIDGKNIFGLKDITETNPIFNGAIADTIRIETDGDKITFTGLLMDYMPRRILKNSQYFTVIHFPSKGFVMLCNTFCTATNIYPYERIEETPHNYSLYELNKS